MPQISQPEMKPVSFTVDKGNLCIYINLPQLSNRPTVHRIPASWLHSDKGHIGIAANKQPGSNIPNGVT